MPELDIPLDPLSHRFERALDVLDQAVVELDRERIVVWANHTSETLLGLRPDFMRGRTLLDLVESRLVPIGSSPMLSATLMNALYPLSGEALYDHPGGRRRLLRWSIWPVAQGATAGSAVVTFTDLSERQEAEEKFAAVVEDLLSVIQHRLNTPVIANLRVNELFLEGAFGPLNERQKEILAAMCDNSREISRLLSILIDLYRYKNNRAHLKLEICSLTELLSTAIAELRERCINSGINVELQMNDAETKVQVDRTEIGKLVKHLAENALKHARSNISLTVRRTNNHVDIAIADDGPGIAPEDIPNLFTRFFQASAQGKYAPVTGAGLCLCFEIARAHGGLLSCNSRLQQGARFTLTLNVA